jgi:nicotinamidase-related amidase
VTAPPRRQPVSDPSGTPSGVTGSGADLVLEAAGVDGFFGSCLDATLRGIGADQLLLTGAGLETCVHSTMRSANDRGYECLLVLDACVPYRPDLVPAARSHVEMSGGIFGAVGHTTDVLAAYAALS